MIPQQAVLLAGGIGSRLYPLNSTGESIVWYIHTKNQAHVDIACPLGIDNPTVLATAWFCYKFTESRSFVVKLPLHVLTLTVLKRFLRGACHNAQGPQKHCCQWGMSCSSASHWSHWRKQESRRSLWYNSSSRPYIPSPSFQSHIPD